MKRKAGISQDFMDIPSFERDLRQATSKKDFLDACAALPSPDVRIDPDSLSRFIEALPQPAAPYSWDPYLSTGKGLQHDFIELAISTVQQGGYLYEDNAGLVRMWQADGSEVKALLNVMDRVRNMGALPALHLRDRAVARKTLRYVFDKAPFARERMTLWTEMAGPDIAAKLITVLDQCFNPAKGQWHFGFGDIKTLAKILPKGLGEDPFLKKASLLPILFAGVAHHKYAPDCVTLDIISPADWRNPQTFHGAGVLRYSDEAVRILNSNILLPERHPLVAQIRAKTHLVMEEILQRQRAMQMQHLDGYVWMTGRLFDVPLDNLAGKDRDARCQVESIRAASDFDIPGFCRVAHRPMNVKTMRF